MLSFGIHPEPPAVVCEDIHLSGLSISSYNCFITFVTKRDVLTTGAMVEASYVIVPASAPALICVYSLMGTIVFSIHPEQKLNWTAT